MIGGDRRFSFGPFFTIHHLSCTMQGGSKQRAKKSARLFLGPAGDRISLDEGFQIGTNMKGKNIYTTK
jgi:hypothetical protein